MHFALTDARIAVCMWTRDNRASFVYTLQSSTAWQPVRERSRIRSPVAFVYRVSKPLPLYIRS